MKILNWVNDRLMKNIISLRDLKFYIYANIRGVNERLEEMRKVNAKIILLMIGTIFTLICWTGKSFFSKIQQKQN